MNIKPPLVDMNLISLDTVKQITAHCETMTQERIQLYRDDCFKLLNFINERTQKQLAEDLADQIEHHAAFTKISGMMVDTFDLPKQMKDERSAMLKQGEKMIRDLQTDIEQKETIFQLNYNLLDEIFLEAMLANAPVESVYKPQTK